MATNVKELKPLSRRKKFFFSLVIFSSIFIVSFLMAEVGLRMKGLRPWIVRRSYFEKVEPPGSYQTTHPTLGYITKPGEFKITIPGPYSFKTTCQVNGLRITHPLNTYSEERKKELWIFGCSYTSGWTLNDQETYPWLLQEKLPDYEVVNFGVIGYGTTQSLIQLREALATGARPALMILSYASFHEVRNTLPRTWMKVRLTAGAGPTWGHVMLPYVRWSKHTRLEILYQPLEYRPEFLLRHSALANYLDDTYNQSLEKTYHSLEVTRALIDEISNLCKANGIRFVLAGIYSDPPTLAMLEYFKEKGIETVDISVDLSRKENTNLPYDAHPSANANKEYARKLEVFISRK